VTIAACYLSPEGVVLGADSTVSFNFQDQSGRLVPHYFNYGQKVFEVGENSTLGIATWGLGGLGLISYRTLFADLADDFGSAPPATVQDAAQRWVSSFAPIYSTTAAPQIARAKALAAQQARTPQEEEELVQLDNTLACGFCMGGRVGAKREPGAYEMVFKPRDSAPATPQAIEYGWRFWGAPNAIQRLMFGMDDVMVAALLNSEKWPGSEQDIRQLMAANYPAHDYILPLREAIDFVHSAIYTTIKSLKFSKLHQICGGPVEIAVITTDRRFRWVRHKGLGDAIGFKEGDDGYRA
jgi:hypothetical protein